MKISSVSKKVLASALSAAMVVAFAPTVALGAVDNTKVAKGDDGKSVVAKVTYELTNTDTGKKTTTEGIEYYTLNKAIAAVNGADGKFFYNGGLYGTKGETKANVGTPTAPIYVYDAVTKATIELVADASGFYTDAFGATLNGYKNDTSWNTENDVTVNLGEGKSVTIDAYDNAVDETVVISGKGTVAYGSEFENVIIAAGADVTFDKEVTVKGSLTVKGTATINGGTFEGDVKADNGGTITANGGSFTKSKGVSVAAIVEATEFEAAKPAGTLVVNAGEFKQTENNITTAFYLAQYVTSAAETVRNTTDSNTKTGSFTVGSIVAQYNGTGYTSIDAALEAAKSTENATVKLTAAAAKATTDVDVAIAVDGVTLDLNGQTLTEITIANTGAKALNLTGTGKLVACKVAGKVALDRNANVSIENKVKVVGGKEQVTKSELGTSTITVAGILSIADCSKANNGADISAADGATVTIEKGAYKSLTACVGSKVAVNGGSFTGAIAADETGETSLKKVGLTVAKAAYTVADTASAGKLDKKYIATGSVINAASGTVFEVGAPVASAEITGKAADLETSYTEIKQFASINGAIYGVKDQVKKVVTLGADVVEDVNIDQNDVTIDLNGHKVTGTDSAATETITVNATGAVIKGNGTVDATKENKGVVKVADGKKLTIKGGTFTRSTQSSTNTGTILTTAGDGAIDVMGGTFTGYGYNKLSAGNNIAYMGGTFDTKVPTTGLYTANQNADGTYTVTFGIKVDFGNGIDVASKLLTKDTIGVDSDAFSVSNKAEAYEQAATAALSAAYSAAYTANPGATSLEGVTFAEGKTVRNFTDTAADGKLGVVPVVAQVASDKVTLAKDKDYELEAYTVKLAVINTDAPTAAIAYLDGVDTDVTFKYDQDADYSYKFLGADATYVAADKVYTFTVKTGAQFGPEKILNSIKDLIDNQEQAAEKATQSIDVAKKSKTVKLAKGKSKTTKAQTFSMGASAETKLTTAKKSGSKYVTVSGNKVTLKKGVKKGTYTAKVSLKAASSAEYLAAAKTITVKFVVKK